MKARTKAKARDQPIVEVVTRGLVAATRYDFSAGRVWFLRLLPRLLRVVSCRLRFFSLRTTRRLFSLHGRSAARDRYSIRISDYGRGKAFYRRISRRIRSHSRLISQVKPSEKWHEVGEGNGRVSSVSTATSQRVHSFCSRKREPLLLASPVLGWPPL